MPEIGVFESAEMNAFATGPNKKNALLAFSHTLLQKMDEKAIAAVAAHEIAHIANGDMITLSIVQSATNALVLLVSLPLMAFKLGALFRDDVGEVGYFLMSALKFVVVSVMLFSEI